MDEYDLEMEAQRNQLDATFQLRLKVYAAKSVFVLLGAEIEPGVYYWGPEQLIHLPSPGRTTGWQDDDTWTKVMTPTGRLRSTGRQHLRQNLQQLPKSHQQFKVKSR